LPIPDLKEYGLLPPGIHKCTIDEIKQKFCYNSSTTRVPLWKNFIAFIEWVINMNVFDILYFNGSYTTDKVNPNDIDCVLLLPDIINEVQKKNINPKIFNNKFIKSLYKIHLYLCKEEDDKENEIDLFQKIRIEDAIERNIDQNTKKGLLMIILK
jgi:hypothetical protein